MNGNVRKTCVSFFVYCLVFSVPGSCFLCFAKHRPFIRSFFHFPSLWLCPLNAFLLIPCVFLSLSFLLSHHQRVSSSISVINCFFSVLTLLNFCPVSLLLSLPSLLFLPSRHESSLYVNDCQRSLYFQDFRFVLQKEKKTVNSCSLMSVLSSKLFVLKSSFCTGFRDFSFVSSTWNYVGC